MRCPGGAHTGSSVPDQGARSVVHGSSRRKITTEITRFRDAREPTRPSVWAPAHSWRQSSMTDTDYQPPHSTTAEHAYRAERLASLRGRMDPLADDVVATFAALPPGCGRHMLETALEHGIDHVPHAPESLQRLFTQLDTIPLWVDWEELNRGGASTLRSGLFGIVVLLCYALPVAYASPEGNKPIAMSGRMLAHSQRRIAETGRFVLETCRAG